MAKITMNELVRDSNYESFVNGMNIGFILGVVITGLLVLAVSLV